MIESGDPPWAQPAIAGPGLPTGGVNTLQLTNFATPALIYDGQGGSEGRLGKWMICRWREVLQIVKASAGKEVGGTKWIRHGQGLPML